LVLYGRRKPVQQQILIFGTRLGRIDFIIKQSKLWQN